MIQIEKKYSMHADTTLSKYCPSAMNLGGGVIMTLLFAGASFTDTD